MHQRRSISTNSVSKRFRFRAVVGFAFALAAFAPQAHAQLFSGPEASAMGNSGRAAEDTGEASFLNPASVGFLQKYIASAYYGAIQHPKEGSGSEYGVSAVDGLGDSFLPGALSYIHRRIDLPDGTGVTQQDLQFTLAEAVAPNWSVGFSAHLLKDAMLSDHISSDTSQYAGTFGLIYLPHPAIGLALVAYDFISFGDDAPAVAHVVPTLAAAVNFVYSKSFHARIDLIRPDTNNPDRRVNVAAGLETFFQEFLAMRVGGYWRETADETYITAGLGYIGPRLSIEYSFQQDTRNGYNYRHLVDLWLPL